MTATNDISTAAAALGRKGGSAKSAAKSEAVRANGAKGGRPRQDTVVARTYSGTTCLELVKTVRGKWFIFRDGTCANANAFIDIDDAREFWDAAGYQTEARP